METGSWRLTACRDRVGDPVKHRRVGDDLLGPPAPQPVGEAERRAGGDDAAARVVTRRWPPGRAGAAQRCDPSGLAVDVGIDCDAGPDRDVAVRPGLDHGSTDLMTEEERERPAERHERGRGAHVVAEEVEVAATDAPGGHRDAGPVGPGKDGLVDLHE